MLERVQAFIGQMSTILGACCVCSRDEVRQRGSRGKIDRETTVLGLERQMWEGRQRVQEYICSCLGGMGARASMKKFILERKKTEEVQAASSGGRHALSG